MCSSKARELTIVGSWELKGFLKFASTLVLVPCSNSDNSLFSGSFVNYVTRIVPVRKVRKSQTVTCARWVKGF